jgi:hypothetical protein
MEIYRVIGAVEQRRVEREQKRGGKSVIIVENAL